MKSMTSPVDVNAARVAEGLQASLESGRHLPPDLSQQRSNAEYNLGCFSWRLGPMHKSRSPEELVAAEYTCTSGEASGWGPHRR